MSSKEAWCHLPMRCLGKAALPFNSLAIGMDGPIFCESSIACGFGLRDQGQGHCRHRAQSIVHASSRDSGLGVQDIKWPHPNARVSPPCAGIRSQGTESPMLWTYLECRKHAQQIVSRDARNSVKRERKGGGGHLETHTPSQMICRRILVHGSYSASR